MPTSEIIIGCMSWGKWGKQFSTKQQVDMIQFCVDNGNSTFDHADIYGDYSTEAEFGKALVESGIPRKEIQLVSKCGIQLVGETRKNKVKHYNYSKEYLIWSAENSLKNLKTDYLDTFLLHRPSPLIQPDEIAEAISELKQSGKIINFGVSNFTPSQVDLISDKIAVSVNQIEFSLTQHVAMLNGSLDQMIQKGIRPMSWRPLGNIFRNETPQSLRIKEVLKELSEKYTVSEDVLLLAWILKHPAKISPVIGTTNKERILNANKAIEINFELEDWFLLLEASQGKETP
ncbi:aldo/keto reductase [uncultured Polaribacter sp.]|uniref:aldo/keto reductase n=1 Tax=uncultured Polaribacter sp. TaxID=174711 RepID=UPI0030D9EB30|tara:strand:- start:1767 stop:2630 length:864 start_codon:yes stop_codon:yes gene_type:complete